MTEDKSVGIGGKGPIPSARHDT